MNYICVKCPHCFDFIIINKNEFNCKIFRHGIYKSNFEQINPHLEKKQCDILITNNLIYGCGKPFSINNINNEYVAYICDYI
jgi:hypothetical protein